MCSDSPQGAAVSQCDFVTIERFSYRASKKARHALASGVAVDHAILRDHIDAQTTDPRTPLPTHTRPWHKAIGHLQVPITRFEGDRRRHFTEHCSATSVTPGPHPIFVTAWHCLDGYDALLRPMLLTIGQREPVPMRVLASGGSMSADWALLRTDEPIEHLHWILSAQIRCISAQRSAPLELPPSRFHQIREHTHQHNADCSSTPSVRSLMHIAITASPTALRALVLRAAPYYPEPIAVASDYPA